MQYSLYRTTAVLGALKKTELFALAGNRSTVSRSRRTYSGHHYDYVILATKLRL